MRSFTPASLAVVAAVMLAPAAAAQVPPGDSVTGDLFDQRVTSIQVFGVDARSGPSGENPTGTAAWHVGGGLGPSWNVEVTCLAVDGSRAVVGFSGTVSFFGMLMPTAGLIRLVDGGGPSSGQDSFEWAEWQGEDGGPPIPGPVDCSSFPSVFGPSTWGPGFNRSGGDLVVTDTKPVPATKGDCKNGGWQRFGIFTNQGECVSFVRHRAHEECVFIRAAHGQSAFRAWYGEGVHDRHPMRHCVRQRSGG